MTQYRYVVAGLRSGTLRDEMPFSNVSYSRELNGPGGFSASLPLSISQPGQAARAYSSSVLADLPVGYWRLGETTGTAAVDRGSAAVNGTYTGTFTLGATGLIQGDSDLALSLAGTGYVSIPNNAAHQPGLADFTHGTWFKRTGLPGASEFIYNKGTATSDGWELFVNTAGKVNSRIGALSLVSTANLCDGNPHLVIVTFTRAGNAVMYVDGVADVTISIVSEAARNLNSSAAFEIGRRPAGNNFTGIIDEVIYYNSALAPSRPAVYYQAGIGDREDVTVSYEVVNSTNLAEGNTAIYIERDGVVVWGGILWDIEADVDSDSIRLGGQGFFSYWDHREIRADFLNTATEQFTIVSNLVTHVQSFTGGDLGVTVDKHPATSGVTRAQNYYAFERNYLAPSLQSLAALSNGFDFELVVGGTLGSGGTLTRQFQVWYPQMGRATSFVWETGKNIQLLRYRASASSKANLTTAIGAGEGKTTLIAESSDLSLLASEMLLERVDAYKDITKQPTLTARSQSNLNRYKRGERTMTVRVIDDEETPVGSFIPGDQIRVRASRGYLNIDEVWRVMNFTVSPDDAGNETIDVDMAPLAAFGV